MFPKRKIFDDDPLKLKSEWRSLPSVKPSCRNKADNFNISKKYPEKNRYVDVLAIDKSRVILPITDNNPDGYINANYISLGFSRVISTQGPLPSTFSDFWLMIWDNRVRIILMLTKLIERKLVKAHCYWPSIGNTQIYGQISVTCTKMKRHENYIIRRFTISNGESDRKIYHIQYTNWPDFGVPDSSESILDLIKTIDLYIERLHLKKSKKRIRLVCHCSAGIGRCGTLLSTLSIIDNLKEGTPISNISIPETVSNLRKQRVGMVQTQDQYNFIYQLINDYIINFDNNAKCMRRSKSSLRTSPHKKTKNRLTNTTGK